jgi:CheY-like chemotaxis protein
MCVWFELQLVTAPTPSNDGHALTTTLADPLRVLVVDDDPINLMLAGMQVERMGSVAIAVPSAASALEALQASQFDVALIDVQMPEMDGLELVRRIRAGQAEQPLLAVMTASATAADREAALAAGADLFVPKPATFNDVLAVLDHRRRSVASPN